MDTGLTLNVIGSTGSIAGIYGLFRDMRKDILVRKRST